MKKQLTCFKCGKVNWSEWFQTCECKEPDFRDASYDDYIVHIKENQKSQATKSFEYMYGNSYELADLRGQLERLEVWVSPMTNRIYAGYTKDGIAIDKVDITDDAIEAVAQHLDTEGILVKMDAGTLRFYKNTD